MFADPGSYSTQGVWMGVVLYAIQIYCDFSGYTDMALGCARALGFGLTKNFHMPYFATNITEFWRRWHISLSVWLRDYLYVPLGGNRGSTLFQRRNLMLTMLLGGLWHGASWNFVIWGGLHGLYLVVHKAFVTWRGGTRETLPKTAANKVGAAISCAFTFGLVCVTWVFFRAQTLEAAGVILKKMFLWTELGAAIANPWLFVVIAVVLAAHIVATFFHPSRIWHRTPLVLKSAAWTAFVVTVALFTPFDPQPFIYFQF
jgi:alginate O-acetyltransferase complex protein AlgI